MSQQNSEGTEELGWSRGRTQHFGSQYVKVLEAGEGRKVEIDRNCIQPAPPPTHPEHPALASDTLGEYDEDMFSIPPKPVIGAMCSIFLLCGISLQAATITIPEDVLFERDVEFSNVDGQHLQLNIARPKATTPAKPAILCIHGGGFRAGTREGYDGLCLKLAQEGYVAATVTYRLSPAYRFPAAVQDCKTAIRWLRANASRYSIDPKRIGTMGASAGGHLALFLGVTAGIPEFEGEGNLEQSSSVTCVVSHSGPSDFTQSYGKSVDAHEVLPLFFGGNLTQKPNEHVRGSPLYWVTPNAAPTLSIHGTQDNYVAHEQAVWIIDRLKAAKVEAQLFTIPGAGHGFKGEEATRAEQEMLKFFQAHLNPSDKPQDR